MKKNKCAKKIGVNSIFYCLRNSYRSSFTVWAKLFHSAGKAFTYGRATQNKLSAAFHSKRNDFSQEHPFQWIEIAKVPLLTNYGSN